VFDLLANWVASGGDREGLTILRVRGQISYAPASVAGSTYFGIRVDDMGLTGADTGIQPQASAYAPWMLHRAYFPSSSGATVNAVNVFELDLKARRRIPAVQQTLWVAWTPTDTGTSSLLFKARVLVALP
jgi:hypothetical protein